jgi:hypothetical protein
MPRIPDVRTITAPAALAALLLGSPSFALAQGTGRSMDIDVSARSAGMGGASTAVVWGDLDYWANPAVLGDASGIRYVHGRTQLVPGLASDVFFTTDVVEVGAGGLGVVMSGKPIDHGGVFLDYGLSEGRDENGNITGTFRSWERVRGWGGGVRVLQALETAFPRMPRWSRVADVSAGVMRKHTDIVLGPGFGGDADTRDWGALAHLTLLDGFRDGSAPLAIEATLGYGDINSHEDGPVTFGLFGDIASPVTRIRRTGGALCVLVGRSHTAGLWGRALSPSLRVVTAFDHADIGTLDVVDYRTDGAGVDVTLMNVASVRFGHYQDKAGQIDDYTFGWGLALPLGDVAGASYDEGVWPQAQGSGLEDVHRRQFSVWLDPFALWRATAGGRGERLAAR